MASNVEITVIVMVDGEVVMKSETLSIDSAIGELGRAERHLIPQETKA